MKPYYQDDHVTLYHGDCMSVLPALEAAKFSSIVTDPPYGMDFQSNMRVATEKFDKIANDERPFIWWLFDADRLTAPGGSIVCFCDWRHQEHFRMAIETAGFPVRSQVIWDRGVHGMGDLAASFGPQHDVVWFAAKDGFAFRTGRPKSVIRSMRVNPGDLVHPNEKPVDLMRSLIESVTAPGGWVLEPFAGSGTTLVAAKRSARHAVGVEMSEHYCEVAAKRLAATSPDLFVRMPSTGPAVTTDLFAVC